MSTSPFIVWLGWACYAGAAFAIVIFLAHLLGSQPHKRPWGAAGLLFTSVALGQAPFLFQDAYSGAQITRAAVVTACLLAALALQAFALFRIRAGDGPPAAPAKPPETPSEGPAA